MKVLPLAAALLGTLAFAAPAAAYWEFGHQTVARIADANITPRTRAAVRRLLAQTPRLETPECPATTIEDASVWADCIKSLKGPHGNPRFGYAYNWHFQDVNICAPFSLRVACKNGNCVSAQITRDVAVLKDRHASETERVQALVFLIHFVGDLHQPLHAGEKDDKGGNDVAASYGVYSPRRFNLHSIWDGTLAERAITTGPSLVRRYPAAERARIAAGSVEDWSRESWRVAHDVVYASAFGGDPCARTPTRVTATEVASTKAAPGKVTPAKVTLDEATIVRIVPAARLEVERGGLRLARLLDEALG